MYNIEKKLGGRREICLVIFFGGGGFVYGTVQILFGYPQVWEEGKDASYNPFLPTTSIMPKLQ